MGKTQDTREKSVGKEFEKSDLGDQRRNKRLKRIADQFAKSPEKSLPQTLGGMAEKEATYRFLNNDSVDFSTIIDGHLDTTVDRAKLYDTVLVVHDTTTISFTTKRDGLGHLRGANTKYGFYCHASLAVGLSSPRDPLGLLAVQNWTRTKQVKKMQAANNTKEKHRWLKGVELAEERLDESVQAVHVMDREADSYELFHHLLDNNRRFIVRAYYDRRVEGGKLLKRAAKAPLFAERMVCLSARPKHEIPSVRKIYPARRQRSARLAIQAVPLVLKRSDYLAGRRDIPKKLEINLVYVSEKDCPKSMEPVEWYLLTTEPIETEEDVLAIVDAYRARWLIEELFKALKTGCQYQKLQLESYDALLCALAIYLVVAWSLLRLRYLSGAGKELPAQLILNDVQIQVLRVLSEQALSDTPTAREVLWALATKGGHFKHNGEPGWMVISRGLHDLLLMEQGFRAAMALQKCDKS